MDESQKTAVIASIHTYTHTCICMHISRHRLRVCVRVHVCLRRAHANRKYVRLAVWHASLFLPPYATHLYATSMQMEISTQTHTLTHKGTQVCAHMYTYTHTHIHMLSQTHTCTWRGSCCNTQLPNMLKLHLEYLRALHICAVSVLVGKYASSLAGSYLFRDTI